MNESLGGHPPFRRNLHSVLEGRDLEDRGVFRYGVSEGTLPLGGKPTFSSSPAKGGPVHDLHIHIYIYIYREREG